MKLEYETQELEKEINKHKGLSFYFACNGDGARLTTWPDGITHLEFEVPTEDGTKAVTRLEINKFGTERLIDYLIKKLNDGRK